MYRRVSENTVCNITSRYTDCFPEYSSYFKIYFELIKSMYVMTNSGKLFSDELIDFLVNEAGFKKYQYQISVYYKYVPDGIKIVALFYVDDCIYLYTNEALVKWFVDNLGKRFNMKFLEISHWFM